MRFTSAPVLLGVAFVVSGANALPKSLIDRQEFTQPAPQPEEGSVPKNTVPGETVPKTPLVEEEAEEELTGIPAIDGPKDPDMWCGPSLESILDWDTAQWVYDMSNPGSLTESYLGDDSELPSAAAISDSTTTNDVCLSSTETLAREYRALDPSRE